MPSLSDRLKLMAATAFFRLKARRPAQEDAVKNASPAGKIYEFTLKLNDGRDKNLSDYKGRVLLLVNTASRCGFTPQYEGLEQLYRKYRDRGLSVLAFPANEFGAQEPGSDAEIKSFCSTRYGVEFDLFAKIVVKGPGLHPLYRFLTSESGFDGEIGWNFAKFLVGRDGSVRARFEPQDDPMGRKITGEIEKLLQ